MPLTPLPEDNTKRYWLKSTCKGVEHESQCRVADTVSDATAVAVFQALALDLAALMHADCQFDGVEVALKGSNVRNPVTGFSTQLGTLGGSTADINIPFETTFVGRSATGRKWKVGFWCLVYTLTQTWRISSLTGTGLDDALADIVGAGDMWLTIDGTKPVYYSYANFSYNDHWVNRERNG